MIPWLQTDPTFTLASDSVAGSFSMYVHDTELWFQQQWQTTSELIFSFMQIRYDVVKQQIQMIGLNDSLDQSYG